MNTVRQMHDSGPADGHASGILCAGGILVSWLQVIVISKVVVLFQECHPELNPGPFPSSVVWAIRLAEVLPVFCCVGTIALLVLHWRKASIRVESLGVMTYLVVWALIAWSVVLGLLTHFQGPAFH